MIHILIWFYLLFLPKLTGVVAVVAASQEQAPVVVVTPDTDKCCGMCVGGIITHGDGHKTNCPCPDTCECKKAVTHPPAVIKVCPDGKCTPKKR